MIFFFFSRILEYFLYQAPSRTVFMFRFLIVIQLMTKKKNLCLLLASMFLLLMLSKEVLYLLGPTAAIILCKRITSFSVAALTLFVCLFFDRSH